MALVWYDAWQMECCGGDARVAYPVAGTTEIMAAEIADGREGGRSELRFIGYLVELELDRL